MKIRRSVLSLALSAGLFGAAAWSPVAHACAVDAYISSICIMSWPKSVNFGSGSYQAAAGQTLAIGQYQALYSLIGNTYGGTYPNDFKVPDLRGRVIIGAGQGAGLPVYNYADKGGAVAVSLTLAQLPVHNHILGSGVAVNTGPGTLAANTTIGTLAANTVIGTLAASSTVGTLTGNTPASGLTATLKASSGAAAVGSPGGNALATYSGTTKFYATAAPDTSMSTASIAIGGSATTTLSGSPSTTLTGSPVTTLSGNPATTIAGGPAVVVTGQTNTAGASASVPIMQPYLALSYYITINGIYPVQD